MPLSGIGLCAGGEHHAEVGVERAGQMGDGRRRQHAHPQYVHARAGEPRHHGGLQELPGRARIPPDHRHRPVILEGSRLGEHMRRRDRQAERHLSRQVGVRDTAHTIRTEESSHWCPPRLRAEGAEACVEIA
jgi:hypothetical protein